MRAIDLLRGITKAKLPRVEARSWPVQQRRRLVCCIAELALEVGGGLLGEPRMPRDGRVRPATAALADLALVRFQHERAQRWWCGDRGVRKMQTSSGVAIAFARAAYHCDARGFQS